MYKLIINTHTVTSSVFLLIALTLSIRSVYAWFAEKKYLEKDLTLAKVFIIFIYIELVFGVLLYFVIGPYFKPPLDTVEAAIKDSALRFWAIEHFSVMILVLVLSQIGLVFVKQLQKDRSRHGYGAFYFGTATLLTILSTAIYFIDKY